MTMKKAEIAKNSDPTTGEGSWTLQLGCHNGTMMSKESGKTHHKFYSKRGDAQLKSLDDCIECAKDYAQYWQSGGYHVWFVHALSPAGERVTNLVPSVPYS